jgi:FkbM family methyltransferase
MKPIWRWTIGDVRPIGFRLLARSVRMAQQTFGKDTWEWVISHNNLNNEQLRQVCDVADTYGVRLIDNTNVPFPISGRGPTLWKLTPPRLDINRHEIVCDNDIVIFKSIDVIEKFLASDRHCILCNDPFPSRAFGRFHNNMDTDERYHSGLYGLPPGFNFQEALDYYHTGSLYGYFDEQGLICSALHKQPLLRISASDLVVLLPAGEVTADGERPYASPGTECGYHFVQSNRNPHSYASNYDRLGHLHNAWNTFYSREGTDDQDIWNSLYIDNRYKLPDRIEGTVIDIGAHSGAFTAACIDRGAKVIAVEPSIENLVVFRRNIARRRESVTLLAGAAWRSDLPSHRIKLVHCPVPFHPSGHTCVLHHDLGDSEEVTAIPFDNIIKMAKGRIAYCKIDAEGAEYPILGTSKLLKQIDNLFVQFHTVCPGLPVVSSGVAVREDHARGHMRALGFVERSVYAWGGFVDVHFVPKLD